MSNRADPPPKVEAAAPTGIGNGCKNEKLSQVFKAKFYSGLPINAMRRSHPYVATRNHFIVEPAGNRWRITVRRDGSEVVEFFETPGLANQARIALTESGLIGLTVGALI